MLRATDRLRFQIARCVAEQVECYVALEYYTQPWWRWTCRLAVAIVLDRHRA